MPDDDRAAAPPARPRRADARRNHDRIVAAATTAIAEHGAEASLEEIARRAGVGSATLHRHFPSRQRLLEAVFRGKVEALCARARELAADHDPGPALVAWLRAVAAHVATNRGLATSLLQGAQDGAVGEGCHAMIVDAGQELLDGAHRAGAVRDGVAIVDLLTLVNAICLATEHEPDGAAQAERLLDLVLDGVRPSSH
ncbi:helix-turn-helix transcriptional regulator [Nonomuraea sp. SMC257]|uniref:Helix-turn-helix transcriptional regulator n=1 Tax=Nonomuraea montanisoli TaxID=2741721 RepID=A0A7Y6M4D7_9ACTN|nr:TetR/AcrR family transcriptional regulator [Nonomuraea montanisoli]NUW33154.1 helix-turn-helix transcriptional regulator [Nonomuraea montanisoli]